MKYNFDKVIDRSGTSAEKVEGLKHIWGRTDLIPLWVADMDFATAPFVTDAIRKRCENEVLGGDRWHRRHTHGHLSVCRP